MSRYRGGEEPVPGYRLAEFLGRGSYGEVWKATGPGGTEAALKFIPLDSQQGLKEFKSIRLVKRLRHPNLVPLQAIWLRDSSGTVMSDAPVGDATESESVRFRHGGPKELVIAMGLGDMSLAQKAEQVRDHGGIPIARLLRYMDGAARGIDYLNEPAHPPGNSPIIHCDIKPANLLIVGGDVQVCDYGVARALGTDVKKTLGAGTPAYAAPELINNDPCPQTDQYSLAISYFELRTGRLPFDESRALSANLTGALDLTALDPDERAVIRRATNLQPIRRYPSVQDFVEDLKIACGVSLTRSGVIGRGIDRPLPKAAPIAPTVPPPAKNTPAPALETVTFPESLRPLPPPQPPPAAAESPWADGSTLTPALPALVSTDEPAGSRPKWVLPLVIALVLAGGGVAAYLATRPGPPPDPPTPPPIIPVVVKKVDDGNTNGSAKPATKGTTSEVVPKPPKVITAAPSPSPSLLDQLRDLKLDTAADIEATTRWLAGRVVTNERKAAASATVGPRLKQAGEPFGWVDTLTVKELAAGKHKDIPGAKAWFAAASGLAGVLDDRDRYAEQTKLLAFAEVVAAEKPKDAIAWYERALDLAEEQKIPGPLRSRVVYKPLVDDALGGAADKPRAATLLARAAADLVTKPFWADVPAYPEKERRADADKLLVRAAGLDPVTATHAAIPHRKDLPIKSVVEKAAGVAERAFLASTYPKEQADLVPDTRKQNRELATQLYKTLLELAPDYQSATKWCAFLGEMAGAPLPAPDGTKATIDVSHAAGALPYWQRAYLLALSPASAEADARLVLRDGVGRYRKPGASGEKSLFERYAVLLEDAAKSPSPDRNRYQALAAEARYMISDMTAADKAALKKAAGDAAAAELKVEAERMEKLGQLAPFDAAVRAKLED